MIAGVGTDICAVERMDAVLARRPGLAARLFTDRERFTPNGKPRRVASLAARFAAKEALVKALGGAHGFGWRDIWVETDPSGQPRFEIRDSVRLYLEQLHITAIHLSLSHDAGIAAAFVVCERES